MPAKKTKKTDKKDTNQKMEQNNGSFCMVCKSFGKADFCKVIFMTLFAILLVYLIVFFGVLIRNNLQEYKFIGKADKMERNIAIQGQGKVTVTPDIAITTMGMMAEGETVAEAQEQNTQVMNRLISELKKLNISEEDIQTTNYNIYPQYNYTEDEGRELVGYQVSQNVTVKIRDLSKANEVLGLAGEVGANSVGGLQFTIDDREVYKNEARKEALKNAAEKATMLSKALGVDLVSVVSYNEHEAGSVDPLYRSYAMEGLGGGALPQIESGSTEVVMNVNIVFEIR
ncbi:MAG: DUF541 domain-containing protein [Candidatus Magasanikbacteria bacterium]|nr:DUF541 domain-containing protein [Candidatus Magasanikbacteria bacterium]